MKIKRLKKNLTAESSAASDVAFLLIIYFLVIAGFNVNFGFLMNLPAKNSTRFILKDDLMRFEMDSTGNIFYNGVPFSISEAENEIRSVIAIQPNAALVLSIDGKAPWQRVVLFVELAQKLQVDSFSFNIMDMIDNTVSCISGPVKCSAFYYFNKEFVRSLPHTQVRVVEQA